MRIKESSGSGIISPYHGFRLWLSFWQFIYLGILGANTCVSS